MKKVISVVLNNFKHDSRVLKECVSLKQAGYDVSVLALHDGQSDLKEHDQVEGIPVHRSILRSKNWSKAFFVQIIKYIEFLLRAVLECVSADILHCNDLNALPVGVFCKIISFGRVKIVYDAHELETEQDVNGGGTEHELMVFLERFLLSFVDVMFTVSDSIAEEYVKRYGISKPKLVLNAPGLYDFSEKYDLFREEYGINKNVKIFLYQGGFFEGRGIERLLNGFKKMQRSDIALIFMGYGPLEDLIRKEALKNNNIYYHEAVSPSVLLKYTASADYGCLLYKNESLNTYYCLPNKLFEYAMAGLPVLVSDLYELGRAVRENHFGVVVGDDKEEITSYVERLLKEDAKVLTMNARRFATSHCWEEQEKVLIEGYSTL